MRVATRSFYQFVQERILRLTEELKRVNDKVSSGKNLNRPSDDPLSLLESLNLRTGLAQIEQYQRNMRRGESWLSLSESVLTQALLLLDRAKEIAVQMASDTQTAETRSFGATEIDHLLHQAISLGNTRLGGAYIFSGYRTETAPFAKIEAGGVETVQYRGDENDFQVIIGRDETLTIGKNGQRVWMNSGIFASLLRLKQALQTNDREGIRQEIGELGRVQDYLNNEVADIGAKTNRLDGKREVLHQLDLDLKDRLSQIEDADYAKVITELRAKELAYQAALLASTRIAELTILNYFK
ncbi:MAG: flagellar hook-associated protein FlgL [Desulfobacterota bacterium]|nr:flagellar hook-associated protein FlgL [Thermodesulfobacteriota bacterium]